MCVTTGRLAIMASEVAGATVREAGTRPWSLPPPRTLRSLALYLAVIAVGAAVLGWVGASLAAPVTSYQALLHEVLPSDGNAPPSAETTVSANAHGLALSSAVAVSDEVQVEESRTWLLDQMRHGGWGVAWEIDAFGDGSITAPNTPFAASTAIAVDGLLDAGITEAEAAEIADMLIVWADEAWTDTGDAGYYWYSLAEHDSLFAPSSASMLAGVTARMLDLHPEAFTAAERRVLADNIDATLRRLDETQRDMVWRFSPRQRIPNDLRQHVHVLWGAERARDAGFSVPWTRSEAIEAIERYRYRTRLSLWPADAELTQDMRRRLVSQYLTAGVGLAEAFTTYWGGPDYSSDLRLALASSPGEPIYKAYALLAVALNADPADEPPAAGAHPAPGDVARSGGSDLRDRGS
jgi:hypothetical protein